MNRSKIVVGIGVICCCAFALFSAPTARAEVHSSVFTGTIALDGDISDFFDGAGAVKAGVCVSNDPAGAIAGVPGSDGLGEPPLAPTTTADGLRHPSGFNQRRVMSAYNPSVNGGTIFVGIDLPGGNDAANGQNPDYSDSLIPIRGSIRPYDADANGEPLTIGRKAAGGDLFRCPDAVAGDTVDILNCAASDTLGFTDNATDNGVAESYAVALSFTNGTAVTVSLVEDAFSGLGIAEVRIMQTPGKTFGAMASIAAGAPQGFDVEFAITNVNANVDACTRLKQILGIDSGSNRDGVANGEDHNDIVCEYQLQANVSCAVVYFAGGQPVAGPCPGSTACNFGVPVGTTVEARVIVTADAANTEDINNGSIDASGAITGTFPISGSLAPGQSVTNSLGTFSCDSAGCKTVSANVSFDGVISGHNCPPITTSCNESIECCGGICLTVTKQIACVQPIVCEPDSGCGSLDASAYGSDATGAVTQTQSPGFCYKFVISNCSNTTVVVTNVVDDKLGSLNADFGVPFTLLAGQSAGPIFRQAAWDELTVNTVTVFGRDESSTTGAVAMASATAHVLNPSVSCTKQVSLDGVNFAGSVTIPNDGAGHDVIYQIQVCAGNDVDLENVTVSDPLLSGACTLPQPFSLAAGACTTFSCTASVNCADVPAGGLVNTVSVTADVSTSAGICALDSSCANITVSSECSARVNCSIPGACRVTGGGKQYENHTCEDPNTRVKYVTHGGQVGASLGVATICQLNTPCIRGEWTHVRHIKGGLKGNFHAASNGSAHDFDSLQCACLPCADLATVVTHPGCHVSDLNYTNTLASAEGKRFQLCNPDETHGGCGPMPRKAPDNKICFSGVGNYTMSNGKRDPRSVVFRVDIEDRSEPGGTVKDLPPDRYRMRIWFITGDEDTGANATLRCQVACLDPLRESVDAAARLPDIDDGGDLDRGNHQIHPPTGRPIPESCQ